MRLGQYYLIRGVLRAEQAPSIADVAASSSSASVPFTAQGRHDAGVGPAAQWEHLSARLSHWLCSSLNTTHCSKHFMSLSVIYNQCVHIKIAAGGNGSG